MSWISRLLIAAAGMLLTGVAIPPKPLQANWIGYVADCSINPGVWIGECETLIDACNSWAVTFWDSFLLRMVPRPNYGNENPAVGGYFCISPWIGTRVHDDLTYPRCEDGYIAAYTETGCIKDPGRPKNLGLSDTLVDPTVCGAGDDGATAGNSSFRGNPVNVGTGNKLQVATDFATPGPDMLRFTRTYNSMSMTESSIGMNWRTNFDSRFMNQRHWGFLHRPDGRIIRLKQRLGIWTPEEDDIVETFEVVGTDFRLTTPDGTQELYDADGRLVSITRRNGYQQTLQYNIDDQFISVTDSHGRQLTFTYDGARLVTMTDPDGNVYTYRYSAGVFGDNKLRLDEVVYPDDTPLDPNDNPLRRYLYEDARFAYALTGIVDENNERFATWAYDQDLRATLSEHAGGADRITISYNDVDGSRTVTNPMGKQAIYRFTNIEDTVKLTRIEGQASASCVASSQDKTYDANGFLASHTDWNGNLTTYQYNARGLQTSRIEAAGTPEQRTVTTVWHATHRLPTQIVAPNRTIDFTYNANGLLLTRTETDTTSHTLPYSTNGQTRTWTYTYTLNGLLATVDGPRTDVADLTTYTYDTAGNLTKVTNALGHETDLTAHNARGLPLTLTNANDVVTQLAYDPRGRLLSRTVQSSQGNAVTGFVYDAVGQVTQITLPDGSSLSYDYDAAHRLTKVSNNLNESIEYTLDALGNRPAEVVKSSTGVIVRQQTRVFDELGRMLQSIGAGSQTVTYAYDKNGNAVSMTDGLNNTTTYAFDGLNRLVQATDHLTGVTRFDYDGQDNLVAVTDARNLTTGYVRNGFGEIIQRDSPDTGVTVYTRDAAGNILSRTDARSVVANYAYDALDRMTSESFPGDPAENVVYAYDGTANGNKGVGRLTAITDQSGGTAFTYDDRGNVVNETRTIGLIAYQTDYAYDLADNLIEVIYPSGRSVGYQRDALGRVSGVTTKASAVATPVTVAANIAYLPFGPIASFDHGNGLGVSLGYDQDYRLTSLSTADGLTQVQSLSYGYNAADNITSIGDALDTARNQSFGYDALQRLTDADGIYGDIDYGYDAVGNRTARTVTSGGAPSTETLTYDSASNRLLTVAGGGNTRTLTYAADGSVSQDDTGTAVVYDLGYNQAGRLAALDEGGQAKADYLYNALQQRVAKTVIGLPNVVTHYHYDRDGRLLAESDGQGNALREYIHLDGLPLALVDDLQATPAIYFVHADHLGAPQKMTDGAQALVWDAIHTPFGRLHGITGPAANAQRLPGQLFDPETGYHQNWHRDYDPQTGRYLQSDPIGLDGGINTYAYVGGNPQNRIDPDGRNTITLGTAAGAFGGPVGMAVGALAGTAALAAILLATDESSDNYDFCESESGSDKDDDRPDCEALLRADTETCNAIARIRGRRAGAICHASASERYAACLRGRPIPPLATWNN